MISAKKALDIILKHAKPQGIEQIAITSALGRVLEENIYSDIDIPHFERSAMDGFAVNSKDMSNTFRIVEDIPAGKVPKKIIKPGRCARIMTGAMLPEGADKVVKVEDTLQITDDSLSITRHENKSNISHKGEDVRRGQLILKKGAKIRPQEVAMLATVGKTRIKVLRQPKVAIISTGSELIEPTKKPELGQIRNSNSYMLMAQLKKIGIEGIYLGIARDNFNVTKKLIGIGLNKADILILTGGVSVGDYDFVREVLKSCGVKMHFNKIAIKPGKPTVFGTRGKKLVFGLPGNPVSVLVIFELFVVPAIDKIVGRKTKPGFLRLKLLADFQRRGSKREQYYPVIIKDNSAQPLEFHGSAHMQALTQADGIMQIKRGIKSISKGAIVRVRPI